MKTIVFLESKRSGSSRAAIRAANRLGLYTILISTDPRFRERYNLDEDIHHLILLKKLSFDAVEAELCTLAAEGCHFCAIISLIDPFVSLAARVADAFGCNRMSIPTLVTMENKQFTREALKDLSCAVPFQQITNPNVDPPLPFPFMLKHPYSTGSKGVYLIQSVEQWNESIQHLQRDYRFEMDEEHLLICETFVAGEQLLVEVLIQNGVAQLVVAVEQDCLEPSMVIHRYLFRADKQAFWNEHVMPVIQQVVHAIGIIDGYAHFELRHSKEGWKLIECNPRIAGTSMNQLIEAALGIDWSEQIIRFHCGWALDLTPRIQRNVCVESLIASESGYLEKVTGRIRAKKTEGIENVSIRPRKGTWICPPQHMGHRLGYVIAAAKKMEDAQKQARLASQKIQFHLLKNKR